MDLTHALVKLILKLQNVLFKLYLIYMMGETSFSSWNDVIDSKKSETSSSTIIITRIYILTFKNLSWHPIEDGSESTNAFAG